MSRPADVIIIGAGAVGCATAYYLTRHGIRPLILEKDAIASHASGFAFGALTPFTLTPRPGVEYPLAREAYRLHVQLADGLPRETGVATCFQPAARLTLAVDEPEVARLQACLPWLRAEGCGAEWLDGEALRRVEPRLAHDVVGALRTDTSAMVEAYSYTLALAQAAEKAGAEVRHGEVVGLRVAGGQVIGVETRSTVIPCRHVVLAAGPWTGLAGGWLGRPVPIRPLKGQIVRLRSTGRPIEGWLSWGSSYFAAKADGTIWAGTTEEEVGFDDRATDPARDAILLPLARLFPPLLEAEIVEQTACLRPVSADGLPILGPVPSIAGAWVATGGGRRGILLSPAMGRIMADLVRQGHSDVDIAPFALERFGSAGATPPAPAH